MLLVMLLLFAFLQFLDPEGGSQKATVVLLLLLLGIRSLRVQKSLMLS